MPDRQPQERLADWQAAERAEAGAQAGSDERRRAAATTRRARWAFEDAERLQAEDRGVVESRADERSRLLRRLSEASANSAAILGNSAVPGRAVSPAETVGERERRIADENEIARELGEDG